MAVNVSYVTVREWAYFQTLKPIFHYNVKPFALEPRVGLDPQCDDFALGIPTC